MTINQIIYNIRNIIKDNKSDDIKISDRQLEYMVNYVRARLIKQDIDKGKAISENVKQDLGLVKVVKVDASEDSTIKSNQLILRTNIRIPSPIELNRKDAITYVGGIDRISPFQFTTKTISHWSQESKYAKRGKFAYLRDGYIYLIGANLSTKYINIEGVFEEPRQVENFKTPSGQYCYNPNIDDYPISSWMIQPLTELIITKELNTFFKVAEDIRNDASDEIRAK